MKKYDNKVGTRRMLDIQTMSRKDAKDYYYQFSGLSDDEIDSKSLELKEEIAANNSESSAFKWILSIKTKDGKIIGKMDVFDMEKGKAYVMLEIPNESYELKYGTEAIDQFIKICSTEKYFSDIYLEKNNKSVEAYKTLHGLEKEVISVV